MSIKSKALLAVRPGIYVNFIVDGQGLAMSAHQLTMILETIKEYCEGDERIIDSIDDQVESGTAYGSRTPRYLNSTLHGAPLPKRQHILDEFCGHAHSVTSNIPGPSRSDPIGNPLSKYGYGIFP